MTDSITKSDVWRIEDFVSGGSFTPDEIEEELELLEGLNGGKMQRFRDAMTDRIQRNRPDPNTKKFGYELRERGQAEVVGHPQKGKSRSIRVEDDRGRSVGYLGENSGKGAKLWEDRWGNLMGKRDGASMETARKVIPKEERR